jgi:hypothetical protein
MTHRYGPDCATGGGGGAAPTAPAVDVTGTWNGSFAGGSTGFNFSFVAALEQKSNTVTGTISGASRASYNGEILGTVSGNHFSWKRRMGSASGDVVVSGDEMQGTGTMQPYPGRLTLRRNL